MKKAILLVLYLCLPLIGFAADKAAHPILSLVVLKAISTTERTGDELYVDVTVFRSEGTSEHVRFPQKQKYWPSGHLEKAQNLQLWDGKIEDGQAVEILVALVDHDMLPWNTDDLIGTVRLNLKNRHGSIESSWNVPNQPKTSISVITKQGPTQKFSLFKDDAHYDLSFMLQLK